MKTECSEDRFSCKPLGRREVVARFDGRDTTSDGGAILLRELEAKTGIIRRFAACFTDHRDPDRIEHTVGELVAQRVYGLALGYEVHACLDEVDAEAPPGDPKAVATKLERVRRACLKLPFKEVGGSAASQIPNDTHARST